MYIYIYTYVYIYNIMCIQIYVKVEKPMPYSPSQKNPWGIKSVISHCGANVGVHSRSCRVPFGAAGGKATEVPVGNDGLRWVDGLNHVPLLGYDSGIKNNYHC